MRRISKTGVKGLYKANAAFTSTFDTRSRQLGSPNVTWNIYP